MILIYFCIIAANSSLTFYGPTLVKEVGFTNPLTVGWIMAGCLSVRRRRHDLQRLPFRQAPGSRATTAAIAAALGSVAMVVIAVVLKASPLLTLAALTLAIVGTMSAIPVFWQMPNRFLSGAAAAGGVALINSVANLAGFGAPWMLGIIKTNTGSLSPGLFVIAAIEICATLLILKFVPRFHKTASTEKASFH